MSDNELVKLVTSDFTKSLLLEAKKAKHLIEVDESSFRVWDNTSNVLIFRGIKIRNNTWGITFAKRFVQEK